MVSLPFVTLFNLAVAYRFSLVSSQPKSKNVHLKPVSLTPQGVLTLEQGDLLLVDLQHSAASIVETDSYLSVLQGFVHASEVHTPMWDIQDSKLTYAGSPSFVTCEQNDFIIFSAAFGIPSSCDGPIPIELKPL